MAKCIECNNRDSEDNAPKDFWQHLYCCYCWDWMGKCDTFASIDGKKKEKGARKECSDVGSYKLSDDVYGRNFNPHNFSI